MGRRANLKKSDGGRVPRPWRRTRPPPLAEDASPAPGGGRARNWRMRRNWPREGRQPVRDAGGFGLRPNPTQFRLYERTYPPEGTPPKGGSDDPLRGSFARTRIKFYTVTKFLYRNFPHPPSGGRDRRCFRIKHRQ